MFSLKSKKNMFVYLQSYYDKTWSANRTGTELSYIRVNNNPIHVVNNTNHVQVYIEQIKL